MPAAGFEIRITGREALAKAFNALPVAIQRKALRPALRAGAKVMRESVKRTARSMLSKSGSPAPHVADSLKIKAMKRDRSKRGRVGFVVITAKRPDLEIEGEGYYPAHVEYGHLAGPRVQGPLQYDETQRKGGKFAKKGRTKKTAMAELQSGRTHVPAVPFMKTGLEAGRASSMQAIADELTARLKDLSGLGRETSDADFFSDDIGLDESADVF